MPSRQLRARQVREDATQLAFLAPQPIHRNNGDEARYANRIASYSKGLGHNDRGEVEREDYARLLAAFASEDGADFERIPVSLSPSVPEPKRRKLTNPQAGLSFDLEGPDAQALTIPPAPRFDSAEEAAEMAELYWMALLRDTHFEDYDSDATAGDAVTDLESMSRFRGPRRGGQVTRATLFRGLTAGDLTGPYVSQFLLRNFHFGTLRVSAKQQTAKPGVDYLTSFSDWLAAQRGFDSGLDRAGQLETGASGNLVRRHIRNARDLATYVHYDALYEAYLNACLILFDENAPVDAGNPYERSHNQTGFGTFGGPHILSLVTEVATRALKAVWFQKWGVHRRLRPEAFGGRIDVLKRGEAEYPIHDEILDSPVLEAIKTKHGSYLLPQAFPEGSPTHPAYGAGHATVAGACTTILKAWFEETTPIEDLFVPVVAEGDGGGTDAYTGADKAAMTVGGELDKVAANVAIGRNMGGVHWRSDYTQSIRLGESIALGLLREQAETYREPFAFSVSLFDGSGVTIS